MTVTATVIYDAEQYCLRGVSAPGMSCQQWADTFIGLGGEFCTVTRRPGCPADKVAVSVSGTDEAVAFVVASCAG